MVVGWVGLFTDALHNNDDRRLVQKQELGVGLITVSNLFEVALRWIQPVT